MHRITSRLTYANVTASIALFLALGGISWAAATLPKNSVGSAQLKKNAVTSAKVKDGSLTKRDLAKGVVPAASAGPQGPQGPQGPPGPSTGPAGGDLTGSYPNPQIAPSVLSGLVKGAGTRRAATVSIAGSGSPTPTTVLAVPGFGELQALCVAAGSSVSADLRWVNTQGGLTYEDVVGTFGVQGSAPATTGQRLTAGNSFDWTTASAVTANVQSLLDAHVTRKDLASLSLQAHAVAKSAGSTFCVVSASAVADDPPPAG